MRGDPWGVQDPVAWALETLLREPAFGREERNVSDGSWSVSARATCYCFGRVVRWQVYAGDRGPRDLHWVATRWTRAGAARVLDQLLREHETARLLDFSDAPNVVGILHSVGTY